MRRVLIVYLNNLIGLNVFQYLVPNYFIMFLIAFLVSFTIALKFLRRDGFNQRDSIKVIIIGCFFAFIGARIFGIIENYPIYLVEPDRIFKIWLGGFSMFGGVIFGMIGGFIYLRVKGLNMLRFADGVTPGLAVGLIIFRIGCFLTGCCYGKISNLPSGIKFPRGSPPFIAQFRDGLVDIHAKFSLPVHPTQVYEMLLGMTIFLLSIQLLKNKKIDGYIFWTCGLIYFSMRFFIDFLRADVRGGFIPFLTTTQIMSLLFIILLPLRYL